jgi:hypothetical protein
MRNPFSSDRALTLAGSLVAIVSIAAIAQAATDTAYKYSTPKAGNYQISALAMTPENSGFDYAIQRLGGFVEGAGGCFVTGVSLPHGATMTGLTTWWSSASGNDASFFIYKHAFGTGAVSIVSAGGVVDNTNSRKPFKANIQQSHVLVNNNQYSYGFAACLASSDNKFYGAKIGYTYTNAGD